MADRREVDAEVIATQIREAIRQHREQAAGPRAVMADQCAADLAALRSGCDIYAVPLSRSHRRILGPVVHAAKRVARKLLTPILLRQVAQNTVTTRVLAHLNDQSSALGNQVSVVCDQVSVLGDQILTLAERVSAVSDRVAAVEEQLRATQCEQARVSELLKEQARAIDEHGHPPARLEEQAAALEEQGRRLARLEEEQAATLEQHGRRLARLEEEQAATLEQHGRRLEGLEKEQTAAIEHQKSRLDRLEGEDRQRSRALAAVRERTASAEKWLRRLAHDLPADRADDGRAETRTRGGTREPEFDYFCFEERFRGTTEEIKERQRAYLRYVQDCGNVLDIGCGRGEFLELLREAGVEARGVDTNLDMVLLCRERKLDVTQTDAVSYLGSLPDRSLGGIFCAQVVEHLDFQTLLNLVTLSFSKLSLDAPIILETLNPQSAAAMNAFYLDPSHVKPIHPEMLRFLLESIGFRDVGIQYADPSGDGEAVVERSEEWRRLHCQDYAVIARR